VQAAEMGFLRRVHGVTFRDKVRSCKICKALYVEPISSDQSRDIKLISGQGPDFWPCLKLVGLEKSFGVWIFTLQKLLQNKNIYSSEVFCNSFINICCGSYFNIHLKIISGFPTWGTCTPGVHLPTSEGTFIVQPHHITFGS